MKLSDNFLESIGAVEITEISPKQGMLNTVVEQPVVEKDNFLESIGAVEITEENSFTSKEKAPEKTVYMSDIDETLGVPSNMEDDQIAFAVDDYYAQKEIVPKQRTLSDKFSYATDRIKKGLTEFVVGFDMEKPETLVGKTLAHPVSRTIMTGLNQMNEHIAQIPAFVYDLAVLPSNLIDKVRGLDIEARKSPDWLIKNSLSEYYKKASEATAFKSERFGNKTFEEIVKSNNKVDVAKYLGWSLLENAPNQLALLASGASGIGTIGLVAMGLMEASGSNADNREAGIDASIGVYNATVKGTIEAAFESIGTMGILTNWSKILAKQFGKGTSVEVIKAVGKTIAVSLLGEANEEGLTSFAQDFTDYVTGVDPNAMKGAGWRALEGALIGALSGATMTAPAAISLGRKSALTKKQLDDTTKQIQEKIQEQIIKDVVDEQLPQEQVGIKPELATKDTKLAEQDMTPEAPLIEEAKKFKSADEFISTYRGSATQYRDYTPQLRKYGTTEESARISDLGINPELDVTIYRGASDGNKKLANAKIVDGDFVTTDRLSAESYSGKDNVISKKVKAKDLIHDFPDEFDAKRPFEIGAEFIYSDSKNILIKYTDQQLTSIYNQAHAKGVEEVKVEEVEVVPVVETFLEDGTPIIDLNADLPDYTKALEQARKIRKAKSLTKQEIKKVQKQFVDIIKKSGIEGADKFIKTITNIQTKKQLDSKLPAIEERLKYIKGQEDKKVIKSKIAKEIKTTKPTKVGQKLVGKYDYESNKFFEDLKSKFKTNQVTAQAELDAMPTENLTELDLIRARFLSLKSNGAKASVELHKKVLEDIKNLKMLGEASKSDADFEKRVARQERVDEVTTAIKAITGDKDSFATKAVNLYREGFSNMYSMYNSIMGKDLAEKYDPEGNESERNTAIFFKTKETSERAIEIYEEKNPSTLIKRFNDMSIKEFNIVDTEGLKRDISKFDIMDIYNSVKNNKKKDDYYTFYGEGQIDSLLGNLEPEDIQFSDYLQEVVQSYREVLNTRNIEITGRDAGYIENYWPATSEHAVDVFDDMRVQGETPSALKQRVKGKVIPIPKNAWIKAQRAISQAEHIDKLSRLHEVLKRLFSDRKVENAIENKFGGKVHQTIMAQIDNISLNSQLGKLDAISNLFGKAINNWVGAKVALNPSTFVRQLVSIGNYIEKMPAGEWVSGFLEGLANPKKTFDFMWKNAPFLEARFNRGYSEAIQNAIAGAEKININSGNYTKSLTSLVRAGDITAIVYGGYPLVKAELASGKSLEEAIKTFESATLKAQQSGLSSSLSQFQNSANPIARLFLAFKNTSNQYFRKIVDATISHNQGDMSGGEYAKTMSIYAFIQPLLYVLAGYGVVKGFEYTGKWLRGEYIDYKKDGEELLKEMVIQIALNPFNAIPVISDIIKHDLKKRTGLNTYKMMSIPLFDDLESLKSLYKEEVTGADYLKAVGSILEPTTKLPVKSAIRYYEAFSGKKLGGKAKKSKNVF